MSKKSEKKAKKAKAKTAKTHEPSPVYKTKKAKKAPEAKAKKVAKPGGRPSGKFPLDAVIKVLVEKNPKRATSAAGKRFDLYKPGMTVAQFLLSGGWRADLVWDAKQGFIEVGKPA